MTQFQISFFGGKKGLIGNSVNLCKTNRRAKVDFTAQNGRVQNTEPVIGTSCGGKKR